MGQHADRPGSNARSRRAVNGEFPAFSLYGEEARLADTECVHIEDLHNRCKRYSWTIEAHRHHGLYQIILLTGGGCRLILDTDRRDVRVPCAIVIPPPIVHGFQFSPGSTGYVLTITEAMVMHGAASRDRTLIDTLFTRPAVLDFTHSPQRVARLATLMEQILAERRDLSPGSALMMEWLVASVLLLAARQSELSKAAAASPRAERFQHFRALVEAHFKEHWSIGQYAEAMGITESRLNRICRELAGTSAFEVTQTRLLVEARRKLIYIAAPVSRVGQELGFDDPAYFTRFFKKRTGMTPAAFRRTEHERIAAARESADSGGMTG